MAGIGFELKKLFQKKGVLALFRAYGSAGIVSTGPMLLGVALNVGIMILASAFGAGKLDRDLLVCMVTYALLGSLTVTSFVSMVTTRFLADMIYEEKQEKIMPSFYGCCSIMMTAGGILYGIFLFFSGIGPLLQLMNFLLFEELIVVWTEINYLTAIKDYSAILRAFAVSLVTALLAAFLLLLAGVEVKIALLSAVSLGYGMMLIWYLVLLLQYFPVGQGNSFAFLKWFDFFMPLGVIGGALNFGLFAHLLVAWASPIGEQVLGLFYGAPSHDVPALLAFLTILITTVNFITSVEVNFYPYSRRYYSLFNGNGSIMDIQQAEEEMLAVLSEELMYTARKQLYTTALSISLGVLLIAKLPLGFTDTMMNYFRVLCIGYGCYAIGNVVLLILLYYTDYTGAMWASVAFAVISTVTSVWIAWTNVKFVGFGFLAGSAMLFLISVMRLGAFTSKLPFHILSTQPVIVQRESGVFHDISDWLERREIGGK